MKALQPSLTFASIWIALSFVALAAPSPQPADIEERNVGGVYICTDIGFSGTCGYRVQPLNQCIRLTSPWYKSISSFGPDPGTCCTAYYTQDCTDPCSRGGSCCYQTTFVNPGNSDLRNQEGCDQQWNDQIGSFICRAC